tara:strand:+ start:107 stop:286 length:180 start_codon:yes stop_codon:yes gene_type:complete
LRHGGAVSAQIRIVLYGVLFIDALSTVSEEFDEENLSFSPKQSNEARKNNEYTSQHTDG